MDYSQALGAGFREVQDRIHEGKPARVVMAARVYATDVDDLWDALTNPERLARWFLPIEGNLELGGRYQLKGNAGGGITRCDPPNALDLTWEFADNVSWVQVRLESESDKTHLTLEHILLKDDASEEHWRQYGPGATGVGWDLSFVGLGLHLDSGGEAIDRDADNAWMASDEGRVFIKNCSDAWGRAHEASGEDPVIANELAESTRAAYTGS